MIEKLLEDKVIDAVKALDISGLKVIGSWSIPTEETAQTDALLAVVVSPRSYSKYTICEASFPVSMDLVVSSSIDKNGTKFLDAATKLTDMLHRWNMNKNNEAKTALAVEDKLSIGGIRVEGGESPIYDREKARRSFSISFQVVGFVSHATITNNSIGE